MTLNIKDALKPKAETPVKKRKRAILLTILAAAVLFAGIAWAYSLFRGYEDKMVIKVSGNIEGDEVRISFRVGGLIEELVADEGWSLKAGDVLARLDKSPLIQSRDEAASALKLAKYQYELDQLDYVRSENLYAEGAISAQQRDAAKTKADTDRSEIEKLTASLALAELNLRWAELQSPLNGYVTVKSSLQGENVQVGTPVFTAVDLNNVWVTAYIEESDLGRVKLRQKARIKTDTYPLKSYDGWVSFISDQTEFTPKYIQTTKERVKYVYRIKIRADNSSLELKPGMPADAYIALE